MSKTLILGLGNDILTDDGIGPRIVRSLSGSYNYPSVSFQYATSGGLEIMELISGYDTVIFIDGIRTSSGVPGDVYYYQPADFRETLHLSNLHDISFLTAIRLGEALQMNLPDDLHIIAIEIVEDMEFGEKLTPELDEKYPLILKKIDELLCQILPTDIRKK